MIRPADGILVSSNCGLACGRAWVRRTLLSRGMERRSLRHIWSDRVGEPDTPSGLGLLVTAAHIRREFTRSGPLCCMHRRYVIPERIYPWLSIFSGMVIAVLAGYLLLRAWTGVEVDLTMHDEGVLHTHWYSMKRDRRQLGPCRSHVSQPRCDARRTRDCCGDRSTVPLKQLLLLGITGGIIPCPAASGGPA